MPSFACWHQYHGDSPYMFLLCLHILYVLIGKEELRSKYFTLFLLFPKGITQRLRDLKEQWFFECLCPRCSDPTDAGSFSSSIRCFQCRKALMSPRLPQGQRWSCSSCGHETDAAKVEEAEKECIATWRVHSRRALTILFDGETVTRST